MASPRPRFSIVSAVYNVEPYLPDFIASIEAQRFDLGRVEVIAVDDGSTDGSRAILEDWAGRRPGLVTILSQPNGGQASARNLGLERATGEWVTFPDPDDTVGDRYLATADAFATAHPGVAVMAGQPILLEETTGEQRRHPRHRQYASGNRVVDLRREPNTFPGSTSVSLFKLDVVRDLALRLDPRIQPSFEDGHFTVRFLLGLPEPIVGVLRDAIYLYRKRAAGTSTLQQAWSHPGKFSAVFEHGYLDVIERARARTGSVPPWLQHVLIYELSWYLAEDEKISTGARLSPDLEARFHTLLGRVIRELEPDVVRAHRVRRLKPVWVDILAHACRPDPWHSTVAARVRVDREMGLQRISYRFVGPPPREEISVDGRTVPVAYGKIMAHLYFGRAMLLERIGWVALGGLEVRVDGASLGIVDQGLQTDADSDPGQGRSGAAPRPRTPVTLRARAKLGAVRRRFLRRPAGAPGWRILALPLQLLARSWLFRSRYRNAWVVMDRIHDADDNGERLFEHLRAERPDINAWFALEQGTPDWRRLQGAGAQRLVAHGSFAWTMLMLNCSWLLSSHADLPIMNPARVMEIVKEPTWKFGFLQHGVIKDDLSRWLNRRTIDFFAVSTQPELASIVADGTGYEVTTRETRNTGLPRFDRLLAKGRARGADSRDLVLVAPTWRSWLASQVSETSQRREIGDAFWTSDYYLNWQAVLRSAAVAEAVARLGHRLAFMPHPALQPVLSAMDVPPHVEPMTFTGNDVQELYARSALLVTDYSSVAFNVAYIDGPIVYFQFDRDIVLGGAHVGRRGYFDYERDGFGPVTTDADEAIAAIVAAIERGPRPAPEYQERIDRTFTNRDGRACARVVAAIEELSRPYVAPA